MLQGAEIMGTNYERDIVNNGCILHNDCFTCPYPDCIDGQNKVAMLKKAKAVGLKELGYSNSEIAQRIGVSKRHVSRYLVGSSALP